MRSPNTIAMKRLDELVKQDESAAEKLFNQLPLSQKVQQVLAAPWDVRIRLILLAHNARQLVQALPPDELYWTVKQYGLEDALSIITMTSHEQFQYMIDLDCWQRDILDPAALARWYRLLSKCNENKVLEWFVRTDESLIVSTLQQFIHVEKIEEQSDISEEYARMPLATLDGVYYFHFLRDDAHTYLMPLLQAVYHHNPQLFYSLVEGVLHDFSAEVMEEALRWRISRIAEHGFPDPEEAASIYQFVSDKEVALLRKGCTVRDADGEQLIAPQGTGLSIRHSIATAGIPPVLADALEMLPTPELCEQIQRLLVNVANKVICVDGRPANSLTDTLHAMKRTLGLVSIGLEILSDRDAAVAPVMLGQVHPEILFRIGSSALQKLQKRFRELQKTLWAAAPDFCIDFFDSPWSDALQGLVRKRPLLFEGLVRSGPLEYCDFLSLRDVQALEEVVDLVEAVSCLLFKGFFIDQAYLFSTDFIATTALADAAELKSSAVFLTVVAQQVLTGKTSLQPLSLESVHRFLHAVFEHQQDQQRYGLRQNFRDQVRHWLASEFPCEERLQKAREGFVTVCLGMLEDEFSLLIDKKTIDTRYVTGLLLAARG